MDDKTDERGEEGSGVEVLSIVRGVKAKYAWTWKGEKLVTTDKYGA